MSQSSFEATDGTGRFRLSGAWRFQQVAQAIGAAIAKADQLARLHAHELLFHRFGTEP
ncbi:hypothetical protein [Pseudoxanthomonas sp. CF125]|uniref:hypothetical protein n=1 Tax=Pseudoxanthomonas sp. CF125 TaxID=1855303 RepID=UPI000892469B|nr:hypothetical protein [Pseudoxanthomonas sp. CF125]SDQ26583.1 hypothetical protein SAMN05216569_0369 [Pseudoxanthomonas sp. CF125]